MNGDNGRETRRSAKDIATAMGRLAVQNRRTIIVAVCAIVFVALLEDVLAGDLARIDQAAYVLEHREIGRASCRERVFRAV